MMVDPAWQAASSSVKGRAAASKLKCARSLSNLAPGVSGKPRTRRAMGSSVGARLVARPAGLSRREKYLRRSTWKPAAANSASRSRGGGLSVARVFDVRDGQCIEHVGKFFVVAAVKRIPERRVSLFRLLRQVRAGRLAGSQDRKSTRLNS